MKASHQFLMTTRRTDLATFFQAAYFIFRSQAGLLGSHHAIFDNSDQWIMGTKFALH